MNVAFPALVLFIVVLPGFLFRQFFHRNEVRTFYHTPFSAVVLKALLGAALFNAAGAVVAVPADTRLNWAMLFGFSSADHLPSRTWTVA
ncbi:hypothetical protein LJ656_33520 [Paraburkholderia sp. MMS20-SJTR3]|uniref:Uncharacterized protein n=1 Tax=Paraburkholderia sejongensis TaxID=2886946 RepID=A0ABS8K5P7_9BURK|nr:hypothetical protein [Paraburkholderia sp. MMS20-SJTR3]MCC8397480.1 hypothetical protein [Paraburkholderia sp. MMS20-SJTR3]